jgi:hypothetical protein
MNRKQLESATVEELVKAYEQAASSHREGMLSGDIKTANRAADMVAAVYRELRRRGGEARSSLLPFLLSDNYGVRKWAAAHALEFAPEQGRAILELLSKEKGMDGFGAQMTLKVWRKGELRFS